MQVRVSCELLLEAQFQLESISEFVQTKGPIQRSCDVIYCCPLFGIYKILHGLACSQQYSLRLSVKLAMAIHKST